VLNWTAGLFGLGLILFALAIPRPGPEHVSAQAGAGLEFRAFAPQLACDGCAPQPPPATSFEIVFLDVGQGDAILVTVGGQRLLVDGGPSRDRLATRLQALGVTDLDAILISNPDADHIRGLIEALALFSIEKVYTSGSSHTTQTYADLQAAIAAEPGVQVVTLRRGMTLPLGGLQLAVLHPDNHR
jgi:beta-lactamase superfamily II metal-dependent hydrolase